MKKDNPLCRVNEVHARLSNFLYVHKSIDRGSLQGCLNLFSLAMNPSADNLETVVLLSREKVDGHINIDLDVEMLESKGGTATSTEIKASING